MVMASKSPLPLIPHTLNMLIELYTCNSVYILQEAKGREIPVNDT